jgi:hypothetical protein
MAVATSNLVELDVDVHFRRLWVPNVRRFIRVLIERCRAVVSARIERRFRPAFQSLSHHQRLMQAGERQTVEVHDELALRVGDPAALTFSINGTEERSVGDAGKAVTVRITKQNYRDFIHPAW